LAAGVPPCSPPAARHSSTPMIAITPMAISGGARKNSPWPNSTIAASASTAAPAIVAARLRSVGAWPGTGSSGTSTQAAR
jgi:hypothetical protein